MKSKQLLLVFLTFVLALVLLAACGSKSSSDNNKVAVPSDTKPADVGTKTDVVETPVEKKVDFPTKNINYVIPVTAGGGFDTVSRLFIPVWEKYLPGDYNIVPINKPGGAWNIGLSQIYKADPDGYTVGIMSMPGNIMNQLLGQTDMKMETFTPIGRLDKVAYVLAASKKSGFKTLADIQAKEGKVTTGNVSLASTGGLTVAIALEAFGVDMTMVPHEGSAESILSGVRGTVDLVQFPFESLAPSMVDSNDLTPIVVYTEERLKELPDTPTIAEEGYAELADIVALHRIVVGTPGIPEDVVKVLQDSFWEAVSSDEFKKIMIDFAGFYSPGNAEQAGKTLINSFTEMEKYKDMVKEIMDGK